MIINRSHLPWAMLITGMTLILAVVYLEVFHPASIPRYIPISDTLGARPFGHRSIGATPLGIAYGTVAFLIFIFAALLGARKKVRTWRIGRAESWMRAHIWLSVLTIPLVLFHCGFHSGSMMTTGLLILYAVVMLSGFYGLALQQILPRQMADSIEHEVIYEQIPYLREQLVAAAIELKGEIAQRSPVSIEAKGTRGGGESTAIVLEDPRAEEARATLREMLQGSVLPYLRARRGSRFRLGRKQISDELFRILRASVGEEYHSKVDEMQGWCDQRRQMDLQNTMQHWLHYWLLVHVPASLLLLIWTAWHAITGLFYY
jgi:hypothetical protein